MMDSNQQPQVVLHGALAAMEAGDWAALAQHPGLYELLQYFPKMHAAFPDIHFTIEKEIVDGDTVALVGHLQGTHRQAYHGVSATGKHVQFMILMMDQVVDGKIVLHWALPDWMNLMQQLGSTNLSVPGSTA